MGDTLTHLDTVNAVASLINDAAGRLSAGGRLVLSFRDLGTHELSGAQRFIPIRSESDYLFSCFLDYRPDHVEVNDQLYRRENGQSHFSTSVYRKLRLSETQVGALVTDAGLTLEHAATERGTVQSVGFKPRG
jgi:hypothetical protein